MKEVPDGERIHPEAAVYAQQPIRLGIHTRQLELDFLILCTVCKGIDHFFHIVVHALVDRSVNGDLAVVWSRFQDLQQFRLVEEGNVLVELYRYLQTLFFVRTRILLQLKRLFVLGTQNKENSSNKANANSDQKIGENDGQDGDDEG